MPQWLFGLLLRCNLLTLFSEGATFDISSVMNESVNSVKGDLFTVLAIVVPAIVAIVAAVVGVKFGIGWLKKIKG